MFAFVLSYDYLSYIDLCHEAAVVKPRLTPHLDVYCVFAPFAGVAELPVPDGHQGPHWCIRNESE